MYFCGLLKSQKWSDADSLINCSVSHELDRGNPWVLVPTPSEPCLHFQNLIYIYSSYPEVSLSPKTSETLELNFVQYTLCSYMSLRTHSLTKIDIFHFYTDFKFSVWEEKYSGLTKCIQQFYSYVDFIVTTLVLIFKMTTNRTSNWETIYEYDIILLYVSHLLEWVWENNDSIFSKNVLMVFLHVLVKNSLISLLYLTASQL